MLPCRMQLPNANTGGKLPSRSAAVEAEEDALIARLAGLKAPAAQ